MNAACEQYATKVSDCANQVGELPFTGMQAFLVVLIALCLIGVGLLVRAKTRA